jgi:anti-sigma regulatory factor (Ser/Thr protein kinase)
MTGDGFLTGAAVGGVGGAGRLDARVLLLDQEFDPDTLHVLRAALRAHARQAGLAEELAGDLVLAVHELAANAIAHGAGYGHLRLWHLPGALSCEITDDGPAATSGGPPDGDPPDIGSASTPAAWPLEAGHGLWLARQLAARLDLWSDRRGSRVVITFLLPGDL